MPRGVRKVVPVEVIPEVEAPVVEESFEEEDAVEEAALAVAVAEEEPTSPVEVDAPAPVTHDGGADLPFNEDEEIVAQRTTDDAVLFIVTNYGRKVRIETDGTYEVVTGPPFGADVRLTPKPGRTSWKEPREEEAE